jgi:hypothetical protein
MRVLVALFSLPARMRAGQAPMQAHSAPLRWLGWLKIGSPWRTGGEERAARRARGKAEGKTKSLPACSFSPLLPSRRLLAARGPAAAAACEISWLPVASWLGSSRPVARRGEQLLNCPHQNGRLLTCTRSRRVSPRGDSPATQRLSLGCAQSVLKLPTDPTGNACNWWNQARVAIGCVLAPCSPGELRCLGWPSSSLTR